MRCCHALGHRIHNLFAAVYTVAACKIFRVASLVALVVAGVWLQRPAVPTPQIRAADSGATVLAATGEGIELSKGGRSLGLRYGGSQDIDYSADAKGAMGARYVDSSTGYVTVVKVNVE